MPFDLEQLMEALRQAYPTSHVRVLPEPAMFLRSNTGRTYHAEGMQILSTESALNYAAAYIHGLLDRNRRYSNNFWGRLGQGSFFFPVLSDTA